MDAIAYINKQVAGMRRLVDGTVGDLTIEQFNWTPPGTCNPIGATFTHLHVSEDRFVQGVILSKPLVWEKGGWGAQVGLSQIPGRGVWDEIRSASLSFDSVKGYAQAVRAATDAYLATLTPDELDHQVTIFGGERPVADVLVTLIVHTLGHAGEIAALKGAQGAKGLPF